LKHEYCSSAKQATIFLVSVNAFDVAVVAVRKGEIGQIAIGKACCKGACDREQKGDVAM
jgi:hypothetical protein